MADEKSAVLEPEPERRTVEDWCTQQGTKAWVFMTAKTFNAWPEGKVMTQAEYNFGVRSAMRSPLR